MPEPVRPYDLDLGTAVRDAAFVDEDRILFTTPRGDGWLAGVGRPLHRPRRLFAYADLLAAKRFLKEPVDPAPPPVPTRARLAVSAASGLVAVNTEDRLVFLLPLDGSTPPALTAVRAAREAVPRFSADGRYVAMQASLLHVLDARTCWTVDYAFRACDWHPSESRLLVLDRHDRLSWVKAGEVRFQPLGTIDEPETRRDPVGLVVAPDADACVIAFADRLEWWALDPPRLLDVRRASPGGADGGAIARLIPSPDRRVLAVISEGGARLWDARSREPIGGVIAGAAGAAFSPSGGRLITLAATARDDGSEPPASAWRELAVLVCTTFAGRPRIAPGITLREIRGAARP